MQNQKGNMSVVVSFIIVIGLIVLAVYSLMHRPVKVNPLEGIQGVDSSATTAGDSATATTGEQPLQANEQTVQQKTMNTIAKNGDTLVMNYTGRLTNGTVFDSNVDPKFSHVTPFEFKLGAGQVIKGWDEGLLGMKVGEKKTLTISPEKGYGSQAQGPIPANSTLIFDVELVAIK